MTTRTIVGSFGIVVGTAICNAVTQSILSKRLPDSIVEPLVASDRQLTYALVEQLSTLDEQTRRVVQEAAAQAFRILWLTMIGLSPSHDCEPLTQAGGIGVIAMLFMERLPLHTTNDDDWQLKAPPEQEMEK